MSRNLGVSGPLLLFLDNLGDYSKINICQTIVGYVLYKVHKFGLFLYPGGREIPERDTYPTTLHIVFVPSLDSHRANPFTLSLIYSVNQLLLAKLLRFSNSK